MDQYRPTGFRILPPVVKNLLIINGLFFLATFALGATFRINLVDLLALHYPVSPLFKPHQFITYMFMHSTTDIWHIFFNMFAVWMFGSALENVWGSKRFLIYYMVTGIGAAFLHMLVTYIQVANLEAQIPADVVANVRETGFAIWQESKNYTDPLLGKLNALYNVPTVGASGSVFGLLLGFGMLFPNTMIYLYFAIPIKAKYFVIGYGILELVNGFSNTPGDNVAHFAHLGGMLFGFILIKLWKRK